MNRYYYPSRDEHHVARPARLTDDEKDFAQIVMHWSLRSLKEDPPPCAELSHRFKNYQSYLSQFCPLIIEDARASVATGLCLANKS